MPILDTENGLGEGPLPPQHGRPHTGPQECAADLKMSKAVLSSAPGGGAPRAGAGVAWSFGLPQSLRSCKSLFLRWRD